MLRATRWICGILILAGWLGAAARAPAQSKNDPPREIIDDAGLFKKQTIKEANAEIADIKRTYHKDVLVETRKEGVPKDEYKEWAQKRAKDFRVNGIYIIITLQPTHHLDVLVGNATLKSGDFTAENRKETQSILLKEFGKDHDKALLDALRYIHTAFRTNTASKAGATPPVAAPPVAGQREPVGQREQPGGHQQQPAGHTTHGWTFFGLGIGGFICLALVAIVVIWVVIGLVRSMMAPRYPVGGPGGGGGGYGPGYGGYGGGGGGGFFSSLLGGMFGAAAGMWMYNSVFGGGHSYGGGNPTGTTAGFGGGDYYGGNANPNPEAQPNDVASGYSGDGGGDWGGDADKENAGGGGDAGGDAGGGDAGGGDWGGGGDAGGGDAGGGGDWGGGGGGGGDWGGGGGGDFGGGGGGGDFGGGGGGGGGDW